MSRRILIGLFAIVGASSLVLLAQRGSALSDVIQQVFVTNFPEVQRIEGQVVVENPIRLARLVTFPEVLVPPVKPTETTRLVEAGVLETDGFPEVVLSLHGQVKGSVMKPGEVGVILIPDQPTIQAAFDEQGFVHFALRAVAPRVAIDTPYFASDQPKHVVAFQAYRVLLYNTTDKSVNTTLFAYLTN